MNKRNEKYKLKKLIPNMNRYEKGVLVKDLFLKGFGVRELAPLFKTQIIHVVNFLIELDIYTKRCSKCKRTKHYSEFRKDSTRADGFDYTCNLCRLENFKNSYSDKREKLLEVSSNWYYDNKEKARENHKRWRKQNPYYDENRCKIIAWANKDEINKFYEEAKRLTEQTGVVHEVDHIIPINHPKVCGLHVPENLQVLPRYINRMKGNKFNEICM